MIRVVNLRNETGILRASIALQFVLATAAIGLGLTFGASSILFDGVSSFVEAGMAVLSLVAVTLIRTAAVRGERGERLRRRYNMGVWHFEPFAVALRGLCLVGVTLYALVDSIAAIMRGGIALEFGGPILYAVVVLTCCLLAIWYERRANAKIGSDMLALDVKSWVMSAAVTAALLAAFVIGFLLDGTRWASVLPYLDPGILALVSIVILPLPIRDLREAFRDLFRVAPRDLRDHVDAATAAFVRQHGLVEHHAYVAEVGRSREIDVYLIVPADELRPIAEWDRLRTELSSAIGFEGPHLWLTIVFTADDRWAAA